MIYKIIHTIFPPKILSLPRRMYKHFYSGWIKYEFHSCGHGCLFGRFNILYGGKYIDIADHVTMGKGLILEVYDKYGTQRFTPRIKIGNYVNIGDDSHVSCINGITIKDNVRMGRKVFITDNAHGSSDRELMDMRPNIRPLMSKGPIIIEENVWIGEMVCVMSGVTIGKGAIVGANAVVTKDIPAYSVAAGIPAKVVKQL